jgi:2-C-methyl-D-erythritol 4-phosphate cytidylyltransferase
MFRNEKHIVWTIVVAAGSGTRFGGAKQFASLGAETVVDWAVREVGKWSDGVVVVVPPGSTLSNGQVEGGATRSESVRNGLNAVPAEATIVCVHDAARPFVTEAVFARVVDAVVGGAQGAVPGIEVADTIKVVDTAGEVVSTPDRTTLRAVQTPQAFNAKTLRDAHGRGLQGTDDAAIVEAVGGKVVVVQGDPLLRKITSRDDMDWARAMANTLTEGEV